MLAAAVKTPELELDKTEAELLAKNIAAVNAHYGKVIDPKIMAWTGLIMACGTVYAPRVAAIRLRMSMEPKAPKPQRNSPPLRSVPTQAPSVQMPFPPNINPLG